MEIVGFNHDDLTSGGKAPFTFGMKNLMASPRRMHSVSKTEGSFISTELYQWMGGELFSLFESDLQSTIKTVKKKTGVGGGNSELDLYNSRTDNMKVFLFSEREITGSNQMSVLDEGVQYARFTGTSSIIKRLNNGTTEQAGYWLRSPYAESLNSYAKTNYDIIDMNGYVSSRSASSNAGVCFGFCV